MIKLHHEYTHSRVAQQVLDDWTKVFRKEFVKVMPTDYKRVMLERRPAKRRSIRRCTPNTPVSDGDRRQAGGWRPEN